jgi:hypothetical protein
MLWDAVEEAIRDHIEAQWALSSYSSIDLLFENDLPERPAPDQYMMITIEGTFAEKGVFGGPGKRLSVEGGIVYFHMFGVAQGGKDAVLKPVIAMASILELQVISTAIKMDGANPPSPVPYGDPGVPQNQPEGNYYRCSGSVPFIVIGAR